ncbi:MAG: M23 family metallopeptidase [Desulfococcaceae bacterium]|nr:M23 family metallopeptidase [Desulfococcaceae bacterium]
MSKQITLYAMSNSGARVRQYTVSKSFIASVFLLTAAFFTAVGLGAYDYYNLRTEKTYNHELSKDLEGKKDIIYIQRKQIRAFAKEINLLKKQILALNSFEKQIRVIANLDHPEARSGLFGVGGSAPEDLDPKTELKEKHNSLIREMHEHSNQLMQAGVVQQKGFESLIKELGEQKNLLKCTPAIRPAEGVLTSLFGERDSPFTGGSEFHKGLDIAAPVGTDIIAPADGKVTFADRKGSFGKLMVINHGFGIVTRYAHLDDFAKKVGDTVKRGEKIATMGNTGRSTGPHLHYEVRLNSVPVDPGNYILN